MSTRRRRQMEAEMKKSAMHVLKSRNTSPEAQDNEVATKAKRIARYLNEEYLPEPKYSQVKYHLDEMEKLLFERERYPREPHNNLNEWGVVEDKENAVPVSLVNKQRRVQSRKYDNVKEAAWFASERRRGEAPDRQGNNIGASRSVSTGARPSQGGIPAKRPLNYPGAQSAHPDDYLGRFSFER